MIAPLDKNVAGYAQQVGLWIAHIAQVSCTQQSQIGLLCQVFDIHSRAHAPPQEAQKASIPALLPPREHWTIRHAASGPVRRMDSLLLKSEKQRCRTPLHRKLFSKRRPRAQPVDYAQSNATGFGGAYADFS